MDQFEREALIRWVMGRIMASVIVRDLLGIPL